MSSFCSNCGTEITEENVFCPECGKKVKNESEKSNKNNKKLLIVLICCVSVLLAAIIVLIVLFLTKDNNTKNEDETQIIADYSEIIDQYQKAVNENYYEDTLFGNANEWDKIGENVNIRFLSNAIKDSEYKIQYAECDINQDGINELLIGDYNVNNYMLDLDKDGKSEFILVNFDIFTHDGENPVQLFKENDNKNFIIFIIYKDGTIYVQRGNGGNDRRFEYYELKEGALKATLKEGFIIENHLNYYKEDDSFNKAVKISKEEFENIQKQYETDEIKIDWTEIKKQTQDKPQSDNNSTVEQTDKPEDKPDETYKSPFVDILTKGYWKNEIQSLILYKFFEDGTGEFYEIDIEKPINEQQQIPTTAFTYSIDGDCLNLKFRSEVTKLKWVSKADNYDWDTGIEQSLPENENFFYEFDFVNTEIYDNAFYLTKYEGEDPAIKEYSYKDYYKDVLRDTDKTAEYTLYDIDKNEIPELIIKENNKIKSVYTIIKDTAVSCGDIWWNYPDCIYEYDGEGIIVHDGGMGNLHLEYICLFTLKDGILELTETLMETAGDYTQLRESLKKYKPIDNFYPISDDTLLK